MSTKYLWIILLIVAMVVFGVRMAFGTVRTGYQLTSHSTLAQALPGAGPFNYGAKHAGFRRYEIFRQKPQEAKPTRANMLRPHVINHGYYLQQ